MGGKLDSVPIGFNIFIFGNTWCEIERSFKGCGIGLIRGSVLGLSLLI